MVTRGRSREGPQFRVRKRDVVRTLCFEMAGRGCTTCVGELGLAEVVGNPAEWYRGLRSRERQSTVWTADQSIATWAL